MGTDAWVPMAGVLVPVVFGFVGIIWRMARIETKVDILMTRFMADIKGEK